MVTNSRMLVQLSTPRHFKKSRLGKQKMWIWEVNVSVNQWKKDKHIHSNSQEMSQR